MRFSNGSGPTAVRTAREPPDFSVPARPLISHTAPPNPVQAVLRPHQVDLIDRIDAAIAGGDHRLIAQLATGGGKTIIAASITRRAIEQRHRVIFTVPALSLIDQTVEKFYAAGVRDVGVIQADHVFTNYARPVQVASVQTLQRRKIPAADLVLIR